MRHRHWKREQAEADMARVAWLQRNESSNIAEPLDSELQHWEQMHMDSLLYDAMERGIR